MWKVVMTISVACALLCIVNLDVFAQGNTVTGQVFGVQRSPIVDANVELLDELSRLVTRTRTDNSGRFFFRGVGSGRYTIRVLPMDPAYEEGIEEVQQIVNFVRETPSGEQRRTGFENRQVDVYLRLRKGVKLINEAIFVQQVPDNAKVFYEQAAKGLSDNKQAEAIILLKKAIEVFPKYFLALEGLANEYVKLGYYEAAQILFAAAVEVNPRGHRSWYGLAFSLNAQHRRDEAYDAIKRSVELYDRSPEALLLYGILLKGRKDYVEAEKQLLKSIDTANGKIAAPHWYLALLYGNDLKRHNDAAKHLRLFLKLQPDSKDAESIKKKIEEFEAKP
jgi:tetratricopeptide (TPR) repeat protein